MKEKVIALILTISTSFTLSCYQSNVVAKKSIEASETKVYSTAKLSDRFADDSIIAVMNKSNSQIDRKYNNADFSNEKNIDSITNLTKINGSLESKGIDKDRFRNIIKIELKNTGKRKVLEAIEKLKDLDNVEYVGPNYYDQPCDNESESNTLVNQSIDEPNAIPNDTKYLDQYALSKISAPNAWDVITGSNAIKVGIIDSGIVNHPDLNSNVVSGWDFVNENTITNDDTTGHGTHVAGIIGAAGNNSIGITGTCWDVSLVPLQVINTEGRYPVDAVTEAIIYATNNNIPILNYSGGGTSNDHAREVAINNYPGLFIAAAGNDSTNTDITPHYPSSHDLDNIISVAATDRSDSLASYSNYGVSSVDLAAPGSSVLSTYPNALDVNDGVIDGYKSLDGTSMAAPYVAGVAALIKSKYPNLTAAEIKSSILNGVDKVSGLNGKLLTGGRLNAYKSLTYAYGLSNCDFLALGDVNGDGKKDLIRRGHPGTSISGYISVCLSNGTGFDPCSWISDEKMLNPNDICWIEDVNGDGKSDLISKGAPGAANAGYIYVALSDGLGYNQWNWNSNQRMVNANDTVWLNDVNGDGKADIISKGAPGAANAGYIYVALSNGLGYNQWNWNSNQRVVKDNDTVWIDDVNGDGKADMIAKGAPGAANAGYIYIGLSSGSSFAQWTWNSNQRVVKDNDTVWIDDVNGDGKSDMIAKGAPGAANAGYIYIGLSSGSSFAQWTWNSNTRMVNDNDTVWIEDVNGDGKSDMIVKDAPGTASAGYIHIGLCNGSNFAQWTWSSNGKMVNSNDTVWINDINGDSKADIISKGAPGAANAGYIYTGLSSGSSFAQWTWDSNTRILGDN